LAKVDINSVGHQVVVEAESNDLADLIEQTRQLYESTKPPPRKPGPGTGFSMEREHRSRYDRADFDIEQPNVK